MTPLPVRGVHPSLQMAPTRRVTVEWTPVRREAWWLIALTLTPAYALMVAVLAVTAGGWWVPLVAVPHLVLAVTAVGLLTFGRKCRPGCRRGCC